MADKIPYVVSSLDGIENADAYEQAGDSYILRRDALPIDLPEGWGIEDTQGLHNTVRTVRKERDDLRAKLAQADERSKAFEGLDPAEVKEKLEKIKRGEYSPTDQVEDIKRTMAKQAEERESELQQRIANLERNAIEQHRDAEFEAACNAAGAKSKLLAGLKARIRTELDDNLRPVNRVVNDRGEDMISQRADRRGQPMTVEEFLDTMRNDPDYKIAFPVAQGGGGKGRTSASANVYDGLKGSELLAEHYRRNPGK